MKGERKGPLSTAQTQASPQQREQKGAVRAKQQHTRTSHSRGPSDRSRRGHTSHLWPASTYDSTNATHTVPMAPPTKPSHVFFGDSLMRGVRPKKKPATWHGNGATGRACGASCRQVGCGACGKVQNLDAVNRLNSAHGQTCSCHRHGNANVNVKKNVGCTHDAGQATSRNRNRTANNNELATSPARYAQMSLAMTSIAGSSHHMMPWNMLDTWDSRK